MVEISWHSRAGQGAVTAAKGLGDVISTTGKEVQAFALYGSAKRGAAMTAYNRIDDKQIINHAKYMNPQYVLVLDPACLYC
jgi:pyruvate ferredoxin oxidoreductase gamma subunit